MLHTQKSLELENDEELAKFNPLPWQNPLIFNTALHETNIKTLHTFVTLGSAVLVAVVIFTPVT